MRFKQAFYMMIGCIGLFLGAVGAAVPMLPAFPFFMLAAFAFGKSSKRLHTWFTHTSLYQKNLESYVEGKGMTREAKIRIMISITFFMTFGFTIMMFQGLSIPCMILGGVWVFHLLYFLFGVKTIKTRTE